MIEVKSCGKLYVAGEYAVLTPGQTALIKNIPIYMTARIGPADKTTIFSDMFDYAASLAYDANYSLIQDTISLWADYLGKDMKDFLPFKLEISGKMEEDGLKYGIGSSGSVTVLVLKALAEFFGIELPKEKLFKLASAVLLKRGDNGSMGDLACIAYEDFISFTSFDRAAIRERLNQLSLHQVLDLDWGYLIEPVPVNLACDFLVGWTRQPAISKEMIKEAQASIDKDFLSATQKAVLACQKALQDGDKEVVKSSLSQVSDLLENLSPGIYTDKLLTLRDASLGLDVVAKSSGAGGGDCGIALSFSKETSQELVLKWQKRGIQILYREELR